MVEERRWAAAYAIKQVPRLASLTRDDKFVWDAEHVNKARMVPGTRPFVVRPLTLRFIYRLTAAMRRHVRIQSTYWHARVKLNNETRHVVCVTPLTNHM